MTLFKKFTNDTSIPLVLKILTVLFLPYLLLYNSLLYNQLKWSLQSENEWQFLILPITIFMIFSRRKSLRSIETKQLTIIPVVLYILAISLWITGSLLLSETLVELSILPFVSAILLSFFGLRVLDELKWPVLYILLTTSLFTHVQQYLTYPLQIAASSIAVALLNLFGYETIQNGTFFRIPGGVLNVADACSGFNQLFTLAALSVPLFYVMLRKLYLQITVLMLAFPVSIVMNGIRITFIGIWNYREIKPDLHGPYDIFYSPFIFLTGLFLLYIITSKIARLDKNQGIKTDAYRESGSIKRPALILSGIFIIMLCFYIWTHRSDFGAAEYKKYHSVSCLQNKLDSPLKFIHFIKSVKRIRPDCETKIKCKQGGVEFNFYGADIKRQSPGRNIKSFILPQGKTTYFTIPVNDSIILNAGIRETTQGDTGTIVWWYTDNKSVWTADINEYRSQFLKNCLRDGESKGTFELFYLEGFISQQELSGLIQRIYTGM